MVRPNAQGDGWNHAAETTTVVVEEESRHHIAQGGESYDTEEANFASPAEQSPGLRRGRSMSVASTQPSVETVVSKAKRAASTLWTLLHAQVGTIRMEQQQNAFCGFLLFCVTKL